MKEQAQQPPVGCQTSRYSGQELTSSQISSFGMPSAAVSLSGLSPVQL
jgi:hypothetical protein